jgi:prepilin-type N-terminal cleavage/methylation domain-containing protein
MRSCPSRSQSGFTLLEVVVALTLMASVLVGSLLSFSAHQKQRRLADAKIAAVAIADDLLNQFSGIREGIPVPSRGAVAARTNWFWRTSVVGMTAPAQVPLRVIRLEIVEVTVAGLLQPLATVDVVEPIQ